MSVNKTWNGVTYSIPNTRSESGWETTLSTYLQALADNAATTTFNKQAVRKATTTPVTVSASTDCTIIVDLTGPGASTVNLPAGADKQIFVIVDGKGDASTNNITIDANGSETIEGSLTKVIRLNRECLVLQYSSSAGDWKVIGGYVPNMVGGPASSTDNAIVRFDGATGKLVQNSDCTISDTGAVSFPTSTTHIFGANSAGNTVVSARTATGDHAVFETRRNNAITTAFGIDDSGSYTNATVGSSAFLGTNGETLHFVTGAGFAGSAGNITTGGAWTLGPSSSDALNHRVNGHIGLGSTTTTNNAGYRWVGTENGGILCSLSAIDGFSAVAGGYLASGGWTAKAANTAIGGIRVGALTSGSSVVCDIYKLTESNADDYTFSSGTVLTTYTSLLTVSASGAVTLGHASSTTGRHEIQNNVNSNQTLKITNAGNSSPNGLAINYSAVDPNNTGAEFLYCTGVATLRAAIRSNGGLANYSANNVNLSDVRVKEGIVPSGSYYEKIKSLEIVRFHYKDQNSKTDEDLNLGVIAQQVLEIMPEIVDEGGFNSKDETKLLAIYDTDLMFASIKALQEAMTKIESLQARIEALENP